MKSHSGGISYTVKNNVVVISVSDVMNLLAHVIMCSQECELRATQ